MKQIDLFCFLQVLNSQQVLVLFIIPLDTAFKQEYNNIEEKMAYLFYLGGGRYANLFYLFYFLSIITCSSSLSY